MKKELKPFKNQRAVFLKKGYELSKGGSTQSISAFK
jgi:hypothetical protein